MDTCDVYFYTLGEKLGIDKIDRVGAQAIRPWPAHGVE